MPLGPGSSAFTGFNFRATSPTQFNFVALEEIAAGDTITFTDNNWNGSTLTTNESTWTWTATSDIAAGTVITIDQPVPATGAPAVPRSNFGAVVYSGVARPQIGGDTIYAYVGPASAPTFVSALVMRALGSVLSNTGLQAGVTAVVPPNDGSFVSTLAAYTGPTSGLSTFADFRAVLNDPGNWVGQRNNIANAESDGIGPDLPLSTGSFTIDPNAQTVGFAGDSLSVSVTEGQGGSSTALTFTVVRSGPTTGDLDFSGSLVFASNSGVDVADFGAPCRPSPAPSRTASPPPQ